MKISKVIISAIALFSLALSCSCNNNTAGESAKTEPTSVTEAPLTQDIVASGEFTVTVHDTIPFYGNPPEEKLLVVSFFQDYPFILNADQSIISELKTGEAYVFTFEDCRLLSVPTAYLSDGNVSQNILSWPQIKVTGVREPKENEIGMESLCNLTYEIEEEQ